MNPTLYNKDGILELPIHHIQSNCPLKFQSKFWEIVEGGLHFVLTP